MAIYTPFPHDQKQHNILCIICNEYIPLDQAIAGSLHANGEQAYACEYHLQTRETWIIAWALFDVEQEAMTTSKQSAEQVA